MGLRRRRRSHAPGDKGRRPRHQEPERLPAGLEGFQGKWVAVKDGKVVAAAHNPHELVPMLHNLGPEGKGAVARYVPLPSNEIVIGVG